MNPAQLSLVTFALLVLLGLGVAWYRVSPTVDRWRAKRGVRRVSRRRQSRLGLSGKLGGGRIG